MSEMTAEDLAMLDAKALERAGCIQITMPGAEGPDRYVPASAYLEQKRKAEDLNRALHLVAPSIFNVFGPAHFASRVLIRAGVDPEVARAMVEIMDDVRRNLTPASPA